MSENWLPGPGGGGGLTSDELSNEVLGERLASLDRHLTDVKNSLNDRINESDKNLREHVRTQVGQVTDALTAAQRENKLVYDAQEKATTVALTAATKLAETHNDLIRAQEKKDATYATKETVEPRFTRIETFQIRLGTVALLLVAIGVGNLVKLWFG
jgi:DUF438 domain-containing protein